jgi:alcohol sulfotransferase
VSDAVAFASYDNMKRLEETESLGFSGQRLVPKDRANPSSYKVRRAKVGGWRDYFDDRQVAQIEAMVDARAAPLFGYAERQKTEPITSPLGSGKPWPRGTARPRSIRSR